MRHHPHLRNLLVALTVAAALGAAYGCSSSAGTDPEGDGGAPMGDDGAIDRSVTSVLDGASSTLDGAAEADSVWARLELQDEIARRQEEGMRGLCVKWSARFNSCVKGKRPADYLRGASCRDAAEHERAQWGAASCGAP